MICLNCKKQIPDDTASCPYCGNQIIHKQQLPEEIKFRRYQRWIFYIIIALVFLGMMAVIVKIYSANSEYLVKMTEMTKQVGEKDAALSQVQASVAEKEKLLKEIQASLEAKNKEAETMNADLQKAKADLTVKTADYKNVLDEKTTIKSQKTKCEMDLNSSDANIYSLIIKQGKGISNADLLKIPVADSNLNVGNDADSDGLSDEVETALGTDKNKADTDGDGFSDKDEVLRGFNPLGLGKINYDNNFANKNKGAIFLQVQGKGEAWYVGPSDGKRYFLGNPANAFRVMRDLNYWTKDWLKQVPAPEPEVGIDQVVVSTPEAAETVSTSSAGSAGLGN